jgi:primosomal protein N'
MKNKQKKLAFLLALSIAFTSIVYSPVKAESEDTVARIDTEETDSGGNLLDILGLIVNSFMTGKIPSFQAILGTIFNDSDISENDTPSKILTKILTNKPNGSYAIQEDEAEAKMRKEATDAIESATLGKSARKKMKETVKKTEENVRESVILADQANKSDYTQRILRKISQQEALAAVRDGVVIRQNQQAQVDRAITNTLATQQLRKLSEADSKEKTKEATLGNHVTISSGWVSLPGLVDSERGEKAK